MTMQDAPAIRTAGLGKRYGSLWALKDCSVSVPRSRVSALVGPNGAGKTTLLKILAGLIAPSAGEAAVLGRAPGQSAEFLDSVGYLAQDVPLYKRLSAGDHLEIGAHLNRHWDATAARARLAALKIPLGRPVATLSGGQRAQGGPSLPPANRPRLPRPDEPGPAPAPPPPPAFGTARGAGCAADRHASPGSLSSCWPPCCWSPASGCARRDTAASPAARRRPPAAAPARCAAATAASPACCWPPWRSRGCSGCSGARRCWPGSSRTAPTAWPGPRVSPAAAG